MKGLTQKVLRRGKGCATFQEGVTVAPGLTVTRDDEWIENACSTRHWLQSESHETSIKASEILCFLLRVAGQLKNAEVLVIIIEERKLRCTLYNISVGPHAIGRFMPRARRGPENFPPTRLYATRRLRQNPTN